MWVHLIYNKQYKIGFKTLFYTKNSAEIEFKNSIKYCKELNDKIRFVTDNKFKSYRNNKLCITCKIYQI